VAYRVDGPIFFGAAERFIDQLLKVDASIRVLILRLRRVPVMDATGVTALESLHDRLRRRGVRMMISGLQPQPRSLLERTGVWEDLMAQGVQEFGTTEEAIAAAAHEVASRDATAA